MTTYAELDLNEVSFFEYSTKNGVAKHIENLSQDGMNLEKVVAGYNSGVSLQYCEDHNIDAWIPNFGQNKPGLVVLYLIKKGIVTTVFKKEEIKQYYFSKVSERIVRDIKRRRIVVAKAIVSIAPCSNNAVERLVNSRSRVKVFTSTFMIRCIGSL